MRGMQAVLGLGLAGFWLVWGAGPLGEPRPGMMGGRNCSRLAESIPVAPKADTAEEVGRQAPRTIVPQPGSERTFPGETLPLTGREGCSTPPRLPARIAHLVQRQNLVKVIEKYAQQFGVDQDLVWAVIRQESGFNAHALSPKGAMGLMQLMPGTAAMLGVADAFDVEQNIAGGIKYLERCLSQFNQNVGLALAAYNAGPDNVVKYQGCPPFAETRHYVASVLSAYAGEPIREDLQHLGLSPVMDADIPNPVEPRGLAWRVPRARWHIAVPQCKLSSPRWKVALLPF
ncbi:MAG: lytic transglycosylase domain-containing protein [Deltaproteobacteria bacterium]|nr:lytic transglycosylase domain-containing protein [Deltaproteobacteria bacterium]